MDYNWYRYTDNLPDGLIKVGVPIWQNVESPFPVV